MITKTEISITFLLNNNSMCDYKEQSNPMIWIDLEMTGLEISRDTILEIAVVITDEQLNIVATGPNIAIKHEQSVLDAMDNWCKKTHTKSGLVNAVQQSTYTLQQAEQQTIEFVARYCKKSSGILCGNSIWQDRVFLTKYMPTLLSYMHYKMIDVSSVQQLIKCWYKGNAAVEFKKSDAHRAMPDILESIAEMAHYRKNFFK